MAHPQGTFCNVRFDNDGFLAKKRRQISSVALLYQLQVLKDTGRYDAFRLKWHPIYGDEPEIWPVPKHLFWDSDVAKWIEGACYFLHEHDDAQVRAAVDELVDMIAAAQQDDGYLNIHFTVVQPEMRFKNLRDLHELYNAGHLIEGALAHERLTGDKKMLDPICKYVDLLVATFGSEASKLKGYPGHPEIELALLRLYERTKQASYLELARFFLEERGNPTGANGEHYYDWEAKQRGEGRHEIPDYYPARRSYWYQQAHEPLLKQQTVEGHSVRAMYLLTALADLIRLDSSVDSAYKDTLYRLWDNMTQKKMYLTGGIGATKQWEGFAQDYMLPQSTDDGGCYAETCASIGVVMLADRLLQIERRVDVADVLELELYNAILTGVSCSGKEWTYVNQLASSDADLSQRSDWFTVACCPPNVLRLLGYLGGYLFSASNTSASSAEISLHLFTEATIEHKVGAETVRISMETRWPLDGKVALKVDCPPEVNLKLFVRIPQWSFNKYSVNPDPKADVHNGYLSISSEWLQTNKSFEIDFEMRPRLIRPHPFTSQNIVAVARGPLVYCAEDVDNTWVQDHFKRSLFNTRDVELKEKLCLDEATGEQYVQIAAVQAVTQLDTRAFEREAPTFSATSQSGSPSAARDLVLVPYYFRANRKGRGHMRVGFTVAP